VKFKIILIFITLSGLNASGIDVHHPVNQFFWSYKVNQNEFLDVNKSEIEKLADQDEFEQFVLYHFHRKNYSEIIEKLKILGPGLQAPYKAKLLFYLAESCMLTKRYADALKLYGEYSKYYPTHIYMDYVRVRIGTAQDRLSFADYKIEHSYKAASQLTSNPELKLEAMLRYLDFKLRDPLVNIARISFDQFSLDEIIVQESSKVLELKRLMRLKLYVLKKKFGKANSYISLLPKSYFSNPLFKAYARVTTNKVLQAHYLNKDHESFFSLLKKRSRVLSKKDIKVILKNLYKLELYRIKREQKIQTGVKGFDA